MTTTTAPTRRPSATLERLLTEELSFSPTIQDVYSDHLAMALVALDQMGAAPERLEAMFAGHGVGEGEPRQDIADLEARRAEVRELGIIETVRRRLPGLIAGPGSALFHPAIRLAYALDVGHGDQVAAALLDWEKRLNVLPTPDVRPGDKTLDDMAASLAAHPDGTWDGTYDLHAVARRRELADALDGLDLDGLSVDDVAEFALSVHVAADAFVSLHMVTGARAVHRIAELLDPGDTRRLVTAAATTMAVLHGVVGAPPLPDAAMKNRLRSSELPPREQIAERAIADDDPHVIKLANVALMEETRTENQLYRFVAARATG